MSMEPYAGKVGWFLNSNDCILPVPSFLKSKLVVWEPGIYATNLYFMFSGTMNFIWKGYTSWYGFSGTLIITALLTGFLQFYLLQSNFFFLYALMHLSLMLISSNFSHWNFSRSMNLQAFPVKSIFYQGSQIESSEIV